jgi:hypothetical protein
VDLSGVTTVEGAGLYTRRILEVWFIFLHCYDRPASLGGPRVVWRAARRGESAGSSDVDRQGQSQGSETVCHLAL